MELRRSQLPPLFTPGNPRPVREVCQYLERLYEISAWGDFRIVCSFFNSAFKITFIDKDGKVKGPGYDFQSTEEVAGNVWMLCSLCGQTDTAFEPYLVANMKQIM